MRQQSRLPWTALPILLTGLAAPPLQAQNDQGARQLIIDPALCVLSVDQQHCNTPLHIRWQLAEPESTTICLYISAQNQPLFCDGSSTTGERRLQLPLTENTEFELRRQGDLSVLARATVTIARQLSDLRPRRRHGWGIF